MKSIWCAIALGAANIVAARAASAEGGWLEETTAPEANGNLRTVRLPFTGLMRFHRLATE